MVKRAAGGLLKNTRGLGAGRRITRATFGGRFGQAAGQRTVAKIVDAVGAFAGPEETKASGYGLELFSGENFMRAQVEGFQFELFHLQRFNVW